MCGQPAPIPLLPYVPPPLERCKAQLAPAFTANAAPGDRIAVEGLTADLGSVRIVLSHRDAIWSLPAGETSEVMLGTGATAVLVTASGPHGDVTYRATIGVVTDRRFPSARINVRQRAREIEITLRRPARVSVCVRTVASLGDGLVPLDLGVRPAGTTRLRLGPVPGRSPSGWPLPRGSRAPRIGVHPAPDLKPGGRGADAAACPPSSSSPRRPRTSRACTAWRR